MGTSSLRLPSARERSRLDSRRSAGWRRGRETRGQPLSRIYYCYFQLVDRSNNCKCLCSRIVEPFCGVHYKSPGYSIDVLGGFDGVFLANVHRWITHRLFQATKIHNNVAKKIRISGPGVYTLRWFLRKLRFARTKYLAPSHIFDRLLAKIEREPDTANAVFGYPH